MIRRINPKASTQILGLSTVNNLEFRMDSQITLAPTALNERLSRMAASKHLNTTDDLTHLRLSRAAFTSKLIQSMRRACCLSLKNNFKMISNSKFDECLVIDYFMMYYITQNKQLTVTDLISNISILLTSFYISYLINNI